MEQEGVQGMLAETHLGISFGFPMQQDGDQQQSDRRERGMGWGCRQGGACAHSPTASYLRLCNTSYNS